MLKGALSRIILNVNLLEHNIAVALGLRWPPVTPAFALSGDPIADKPSTKSLAESVLDDMREGILWAVPKHRRPLWKRKMRMFGLIEKHYKLLRPKNNLLTCMHCGHWHEPGILCVHCYRKVMDETNLVKDKIVATLELKPVEQEVVVLYKDEISDTPSEFYKGKRIVEIDRPRPSWWSENLAQPSTQQPSDSTEVKPLDVA